MTKKFKIIVMLMIVSLLAAFVVGCGGNAGGGNTGGGESNPSGQESPTDSEAETEDPNAVYVVKFDTCIDLPTNKALDQKAHKGDLVVEPDIRVRGENPDGYRVAGWYTDREYEAEWDFGLDKVAGDMTLYAKWDAYYDVNFYLKGLEIPVYSTEVKKGRKTGRCDDSIYGYKVKGYYLSEDFAEGSEFDFDEPITSKTDIYIDVEDYMYFDSKSLANGFRAVAAISGAGSTAGSISEETKNGEEFSKELGSLCDLFVNDAFGAAHRAHSSTVGVASYVKESANGFLMAKEIKFLGDAVNNPTRPFVTILGGAKVADKLAVIENLLNKADVLIIGGGMAYTFLKAQGKEIGTSLLDPEKIDYCKEMLDRAKAKGVELLLPVDCVVAKSFPDPIDAAIETEVVDADHIPADMMGLDIGPKTRELYAAKVKEAKTVVWNGPMGVFENPELAKGTIAVAQALADTDATTIIGGGDSAAAVNQLGFGSKMSHISTGGGASLEYLEGKELPGIAAMTDK